jgi:hypothetical protein
MMQSWPMPIKGVSKGLPVDKEEPATSGYMNNVRPKDVLEKRIRLGQRPGLDKWSVTQVGGVENPVVYMCVVSAIQ